jgi:hypothetical protein
MMSDVVNESLVQERFLAQMGSAFSLIGTGARMHRLYGVMSYAVTRRTNEIGIAWRSVRGHLMSCASC